MLVNAGVCSINADFVPQMLVKAGNALPTGIYILYRVLEASKALQPLLHSANAGKG